MGNYPGVGSIVRQGRDGMLVFEERADETGVHVVGEPPLPEKRFGHAGVQDGRESRSGSKQYSNAVIATRAAADAKGAGRVEYPEVPLELYGVIMSYGGVRRWIEADPHRSAFYVKVFEANRKSGGHPSRSGKGRGERSRSGRRR
jgi:hypothetical protein